MYKILLLDDDIKFVVQIQELFPRDTEWLATVDTPKALNLLKQQTFDFVIVRKKNESILHECLSNYSESTSVPELKLFKRVILLPRHTWRRYLKKQLFKSV